MANSGLIHKKELAITITATMIKPPTCGQCFASLTTFAIDSQLKGDGFVEEFN
jgi:hypothetical protein